MLRSYRGASTEGVGGTLGKVGGGDGIPVLFGLWGCSHGARGPPGTQGIVVQGHTALRTPPGAEGSLRSGNILLPPH